MSTAAQEAQTAFDALSLEDSDTDCVSVSSIDTQTTITFNNCVFEGITVNGQMTVTSTDTLTNTSGNLTLAGPGLPSSPTTVSWNMVISIGDVVSITGEITVNGTTYTYDELGVTY